MNENGNQKTLINPVTARPDKLEGGEIMAVIVTCHVKRGLGDRLTYQLYRCPFPPGDSIHEGVPQGMRIDNEGIVAGQLFPVVRYANAIPDTW